MNKRPKIDSQIEANEQNDKNILCTSCSDKTIEPLLYVDGL